MVWLLPKQLIPSTVPEFLVEASERMCQQWDPSRIICQNCKDLVQVKSRHLYTGLGLVIDILVDIRDSVRNMQYLSSEEV